MARAAPANSMLFTFRMTPLIAAELAARSIDAATILVEAGLPVEALRGDITAPLARVQRFIDLAAAALHAPLFGFDLAARIPTGAFGLAEFAMRSAATVAGALRTLHDVAPLINPIGRFSFTESATGGELHYAIPAQRDALGMHLNEYTIALIARQLGGPLEGGMQLAKVWFPHTRKDNAEEVAARLKAPVHFQAGDCGFALTPDTLARPLRTADPDLHKFMLEQAKAQLSRISNADIITTVARVIELRLASGKLAIADIAAAMATTARSLQRHLADAGTEYREVLGHVRTRRRDELKQSGMREADIATQLGFADARSMRRALDE